MAQDKRKREQQYASGDFSCPGGLLGEETGRLLAGPHFCPFLCCSVCKQCVAEARDLSQEQMPAEFCVPVELDATVAGSFAFETDDFLGVDLTAYHVIDSAFTQTTGGRIVNARNANLSYITREFWYEWSV